MLISLLKDLISNVLSTMRLFKHVLACCYTPFGPYPHIGDSVKIYGWHAILLHLDHIICHCFVMCEVWLKRIGHSYILKLYFAFV